MPPGRDHRDAQPGALGALVAGCTCPPKQTGPEYMAEKDCPLHGLGILATELGVELPQDDGNE